MKANMIKNPKALPQRSFVPSSDEGHDTKKSTERNKQNRHQAEGDRGLRRSSHTYRKVLFDSSIYRHALRSFGNLWRDFILLPPRRLPRLLLLVDLLLSHTLRLRYASPRQFTTTAIAFVPLLLLLRRIISRPIEREKAAETR